MPQRDMRSDRNPVSISQVSFVRNQLQTGNVNDLLTDCITDDLEDVMVPGGTGYVTDMFELTSVQQTD